MAKCRSHHNAMVEMLREDPNFIQAYLHEAFLDIDEQGGQEAFLIALRHVVEARFHFSAWANDSELYSFQI